jgi:hypothetical protein
VPKKTKTVAKRAEVISEPPIAADESRIEKAPRRASSKARKTSAKKAPQAAAKKTALPKSTAAGSQPTDEQIRLRAYFISERRHRLRLPGDASSDWLEAKRQLLADVANKRK